ncbi:hypothetical protein [Profundibacter sp.]|uniref:hypothetical protein n=1 Tax=Profundibacter sp. TaxID=3101071 RepID=UPI003D0A1CE4
MTMTELDSRGLIRESYRIEGINAPECRSIFLDWALGAVAGDDLKLQIAKLLAQYSDEFPDHPMTQVLREGLAEAAPNKRRGGRKARLER